MSTIPKILQPADLPSPDVFRKAFEVSRQARTQLAPSALLSVNLEVQTVALTVIGTVAHVMELREEMAAQLPSIDLQQIDSLKVFAEACFFAHMAYLAASGAGEELPKLVARATEIRDLFLSDLSALAKRSLIDGTRLAEIKKGPGYVNAATDLGVMVQMFRERWDAVSTRSGIRPEELDEAEQISARIAFAYADRTTQSAAIDTAADNRNRAYTLMVQAYDEARRAATFLRWKQGDVDQFVPSLWAGRGGRGSKASDAHAPDAPGGTEPAAKADGAVAKKEGAAEGPAAAPTTAAPVPPGHPGGSPFSS